MDGAAERVGMTPAMRTTRAGVFAGAAVLLAAAAHVAGGGAAPPVPVTGVLGLLLCLPFLLLPARPSRPALGVLGLGAAQAILHSAFMTLSPAEVCDMSAMAGHHAATATGTGCHAAAGAATAAAPTGAAMIAAHAVAVVLPAVLISRGERAAWYLLTWMVPALRAVLAVPVVVVRPWLAPWPQRPVPARTRVVAGVQRRGPPGPVPA